MQNDKIYYLGLDIGTDSIGYAAATPQYELLKLHGAPAWGVTVFDEAALNAERRGFRTARRRLDRRQQRVLFIQELFAKEIGKIDPRFFIRQRESWKHRDETDDPFVLFGDAQYTDADYFRDYPTIHHLLCDLMDNPKPHDVRLVYLACAWLVAHRGNFLSGISVNQLSDVKDLSSAYTEFMDFFIRNGYDVPWSCRDVEAVGAILKSGTTVTSKKKALTSLLSETGKFAKEATESFPFSRAGIVGLLCGGKCSLKELFGCDEYADLTQSSISLDMDEEKFDLLESEIGDDFALIRVLRGIFDWAVLNDILGDAKSISAAKVRTYEQHRRDLAFLKAFVKRHCPDKFNEIFRDTDKPNYAAYTRHSDAPDAAELKHADKENFSGALLKTVKGIKPDKTEAAQYADMIARLELRTFLPKQKDTANRVIPNQLYLFELQEILKNAAGYLPFLLQKDADGLTCSEKIRSVFLFRIPYYVGPLNAYAAPGTKENRRPWIVRRGEGVITPWNFEEKVDLDASEEAFIRRMTNQCTYVPGEDVLPKDSLLYHQFAVLNEINNLRINGERISVELKQRIFNEVFLQKKKVTKKRILDFLIANGVIEKEQTNLVSGIDEKINADLVPQIAFRNLMQSGTLSETDVERIIERATFTEDKARLSDWLARHFTQLGAEDRKYVCSIRIRDFGRLSRFFLCELNGVEKETGEVRSIIGALWDTQYNLMELLSDRFTFGRELQDLRAAYYAEHSTALDDRLDEMRASNAVRRCVYRTLAVTKDVEKAFGTPKKIFVETTRGAAPDQKNRRTRSRREQILDLYDKCRDEDVRLLQAQLNELGDHADSRLQSDKLFLYFLQMGKCLYTGKAIDITKLGSGEYNIEHIYPQSYVKDDSIINNEILVDSVANGEKKNDYPVRAEIRQKMKPFWDLLLDRGMMSEEKHRRLTRSTGFSVQEKTDFINRQLTETSQAVKIVAEILQIRYPEAEIVYSKASNVSAFRQAFKIWKSRSFNDLHHASDAYLNVVVGNVYSMRFTKRWFDPGKEYSVKPETLFTHPVKCGAEIVWEGAAMKDRVKEIAQRQDAHFTKFAFMKKGGFFDQMPVRAGEKLVPLKKDRPTALYGGYNKAGAAFFIPVSFTAKNKKDVLITSVEILYAERVLADRIFAETYLKKRVEYILGKPVDAVTFPLGLRPWKINTMLSLDGFRICIAGSAGGGKCLIAQPVVQFTEAPEWIRYLKRLESFVEKTGKNGNYVYDETFDEVSAEKNEALYDIYLDKLQHSVFAKRVNSPLQTLETGKTTFKKLEFTDQCRALLNIHQVFGRVSGGCDLTLIGGAGRAASTVNFSALISNWKKYYPCVRRIDASPAGLWERRSENLLDLF